MSVSSDHVFSTLIPDPRSLAPDQIARFAALYVTSSDGPVRAALIGLARSFSPRIELQGERLVLLDVSGLRRMFGAPPTLGERVCRAASERGWSIQAAIAATRTAALLMAIGRSGLTVVPPGSEATMLAALPLNVLRTLAQEQSRPAFGLLSTVQRWGLKTLGDLAALPPADLFERGGAGGLELLRLARGEDERPLVPDPVEERYETSLALEWPIETLEPLAFVLSRVLDPLCARLEERGVAAAALHVRLTLVTRESYVRMLQLPMPLRDARVLRTLILLDLESHPCPAGIDHITVAIDPVPARTVQFSLLERARPTAAALSTLLARLDALMGEGRCGRPELVDAHRPGAFEMRPFNLGVGEEHASREQRQTRPPSAYRLFPSLRRFRHPVAARVGLEQGRPVRVATGYQTSGGGRVMTRAGPWRRSGEWWKPGGREPRAGSEQRQPLSPTAYRLSPSSWDHEEWDVALSDGGVYRLFRDRQRDRWFVEGVLD